MIQASSTRKEVHYLFIKSLFRVVIVKENEKKGEARMFIQKK